jgi:uncharacterized protein DUF973
MTWVPQSAPVVDAPQTDLAALSNIWNAALIAIIGSALGVAVPLVLSSTGYYSFSVPAAGAPVRFTAAHAYAVLGVAVVGVVISVVSFWYYRRGFLALRGIDAKFASSPTWALLVIIGLPILALGLLALLASLLQLLACAGTSITIPASCVNVGSLLGGLGLLAIGLIVLFIGYIGTLVAIWRLGDRYGNSLFKIGAVLLIFPFLSIVGQILVLVASSSAQTTVRQRPPMMLAPAFPSPPPPPPPPPLW